MKFIKVQERRPAGAGIQTLAVFLFWLCAAAAWGGARDLDAEIALVERRVAVLEDELARLLAEELAAAGGSSLAEGAPAAAGDGGHGAASRAAGVKTYPLRGLVEADIAVSRKSAETFDKQVALNVKIPDQETLDRAVGEAGHSLGLLFYLWSHDHDLHSFQAKYPKGGGRWKGGLLSDRAMLIQGGELKPGTPLKPMGAVIPAAGLEAGKYSVVAEFRLITPQGEPADVSLFGPTSFSREFSIGHGEDDAAAIAKNLDFRLEARTGESMSMYYMGESREMPGITRDRKTLRDAVADGAKLPICYERLVVSQHFISCPRAADTRAWYRLVDSAGAKAAESLEEVSMDSDRAVHVLFLAALPGGDYTIQVYHNDLSNKVQKRRDFRFSLYPADMRDGGEPRHGVYRAANRGDANRIEALLAAGASIGAENGGHAVFAAASGGHLPALKVLLAAGANPNFTHNEVTPIMVGASLGHAAMVEALAAAGVDINARGYRRCTPLHFAVFKNRRSVVETLLCGGASTSLTDDQGNTAGYYAWWLLKDRELARRLGYHVPEKTVATNEDADEFLRSVAQGMAQVSQAYQERRAASANQANSAAASSRRPPAAAEHAPRGQANSAWQQTRNEQRQQNTSEPRDYWIREVLYPPTSVNPASHRTVSIERNSVRPNERTHNTGVVSRIVWGPGTKQDAESVRARLVRDKNRF